MLHFGIYPSRSFKMHVQLRNYLLKYTELLPGSPEVLSRRHPSWAPVAHHILLLPSPSPQNLKGQGWGGGPEPCWQGMGERELGLPLSQRRWDGRICWGRTKDLVEEWLGTLNTPLLLWPGYPKTWNQDLSWGSGRSETKSLFLVRQKTWSLPESTKKHLISSQLGRPSVQGIPYIVVLNPHHPMQ